MTDTIHLFFTFLYGQTLERISGAYQEGRHFIERSLAIERELGNRKRIAMNLGTLGTIVRLQGEYEASRLYYEEALAIQEDIGARPEAANTILRLGNLALAQGNYADARSYFERSLATLRHIGELIGIAGTLNNLGVVAVIQGNFQGAKGYFEESLVIKRQIGDRLGIADSLKNLGALAFRQKAYQEAEPYFRESLTILREIKHTSVNSSLGWLGRILSQMGRIDEARGFLLEALNGLDEGNVAQRVALMLLTAEFYAKQNRLEEAIELVGFIQEHPKSDAETRGDAAALLTEIRASLVSERIDNALERGRSLTLDTLIERLLSERATPD